MTPYEETRRAVGRKRASKMSLGGDKLEDTVSHLEFQSAWLSARYSMGEARARVVAELAFAKGTLR